MIKVGDRLPNIDFYTMTGDGKQKMASEIGWDEKEKQYESELNVLRRKLAEEQSKRAVRESIVPPRQGAQEAAAPQKQAVKDSVVPPKQA